MIGTTRTWPIMTLSMMTFPFSDGWCEAAPPEYATDFVAFDVYRYDGYDNTYAELPHIHVCVYE